MIIIVNETQKDFFIVKEGRTNEDRIYLMTRLPKDEEKAGNKHLGYLNNNRVGDYWSVRPGYCDKAFAKEYVIVPKKKTTKLCIRAHEYTTFYKGAQISIVEGKQDDPKYGGQTRVVLLTDSSTDDAYSPQKISHIDTDLKVTPLSEDVQKYEEGDVAATVFTFRDRSFVAINDTNTYIWVSPNKKLKVGTVTITMIDGSGDKVTINALIRCHPDGSFMMDDKKAANKKSSKPAQKGQNKFKKQPSKNSNPKTDKPNNNKQAKSVGKPRVVTNDKSFDRKNKQYNGGNKQYVKKENKSFNNNRNTNNKPKDGSRSRSLSKLERNKNKYH